MRRTCVVPALSALVIFGTLVPGTGSGQAATTLTKKTCHYATKIVHGKKKGVRVCKTVKKPAPTPLPSPIPAPALQYFPIGVAVDGAGNIVVEHNGEVTKYGPDGAQLATTGRFLIDRANCGPWGLALSAQGSIYVADDCGPTVTALSPSLQKLWSVTGGAREQYDNLVVDRQGNIDVSSAPTGTIDQISADGTHRTTLYTIGADDPFTNDPWAAAIDPDGNVQVTLISSAILIKLSPSGSLLSHSAPLPGYSEIDDIAIDSHGFVYLTAGPGCQCRDVVIKLSPSWQVLGVVAPQGSGQGQVDTPLGLAVDSQDNLYVADAGNRRVDKFSPSGKFLLSFAGTP